MGFFGKEKVNAAVTVLLLFAVILVFTIADIAGEDRLYSETENRLLASKPELSAENLIRGSFARDYENYVTDQFVSRDKWISIKTYVDLILQKQEMGGVYLGKDGYLLEQHSPEDYTRETIDKRLQLLKKLVDDWEADVMLVPTADNILTDKMPANAPCFSQEFFLEEVRDLVGSEHYVDAFSMLKEHSEEEIYYRTDHHWTSLGAYYGYRA